MNDIPKTPPLSLAKSLQRKREPRKMRVQVRDEDGRFVREWFVEVYPTGSDEKDALRGVLHLRDILVWGPSSEDD